MMHSRLGRRRFRAGPGRTVGFALAVSTALVAALPPIAGGQPPKGPRGHGTTATLVQAGDVAPPPDLTSDNVTSQVEAAVPMIDNLETVVNGWGLGCATAASYDLQLGYAADALNQGNFLGARALLTVLQNEVDQQKAAGLLPLSADGDFDTADATDLAAIPTGGYDSTDFQPAGSISILTPPGCPVLSATDLDSPQAVDSAWEAIRLLLQGAVASALPEGGELVAALIEIMWPGKSENNVTWDQMQEYVERAVNQAIDTKTKDDLNSTLDGLRSVMHLYLVAIQAEKPWSEDVRSYIRDQFVAALGHLEHDAPMFQPATRPYLVLTEWTQLQNMLLGQLRDGIINGASYGIPQNAIDDYKSQLASRIAAAVPWSSSQLAAAHASLPDPPPGEHHDIDRYNQNASLDLQLVPAVSDEAFYWPYLDPVKYPQPVHPSDTRTVYTPSFGEIPYAKLPPFGGPRPPIVHFTGWGNGAWVQAFQLTYGLGSQPDPAMGYRCSGTRSQGCDTNIDPPHGGSWQAALVSDGLGWITGVSGRSGDVPESLQLTFVKNGTAKTVNVGSTNSGAQPFSVQLPDEVVSFALIPGKVTRPYQSADGMIFGFRYLDSY